MKYKIIILLALLSTATLQSFRNKDEINECYISFTAATGLTASKPDRLPETSERNRTVKTEQGEVTVTRVDGYRVLYNNAENAPFVNVKIERSSHGFYATDQRLLLDNLAYLNAHSQGMETKELIELKFNGYKISGLSRETIETGSILGTFIMFPGNDVTVYFYFNNLKPGFRNFESVADYKMQRDKFFEEYTKHLKTCSDKQ